MKAIINKQILTLFLMTISFAGLSQVNLGIKAGAGTGNLSIDYDGYEQAISGENIVGFEIGPYLNIQASNIYVRPEALYMYRQGNVSASTDAEVSIHRIQLPVIVGVQILGPLAIEGGPTYHHTVYFDHGFNENITIRQNAFGYRVGPSIHIGRFMAYANYEGFVFSTGRGSELKEPYRLNVGIGLEFGDPD